MNVQSKLECLSLGDLYSQVYYLRIRLGVENLKGASLGYAPALLANIRVCLKGIPGTNTPAFYRIFN